MSSYAGGYIYNNNNIERDRDRDRLGPTKSFHNTKSGRTYSNNEDNFQSSSSSSSSSKIGYGYNRSVGFRRSTSQERDSRDRDVRERDSRDTDSQQLRHYTPSNPPSTSSVVGGYNKRGGGPFYQNRAAATSSASGNNNYQNQSGGKYRGYSQFIGRNYPQQGQGQRQGVQGGTNRAPYDSGPGYTNSYRQQSSSSSSLNSTPIKYDSWNNRSHNSSINSQNSHLPLPTQVYRNNEDYSRSGRTIIRDDNNLKDYEEKFHNSNSYDPFQANKVNDNFFTNSESDQADKELDEKAKKAIMELKMNGIFDTIRRNFLTDANNNPSYSDLSKQVSDSTNSFLRKLAWSKSLNRNSLRETLKSKITEASFYERGLKKILETTVENKVRNEFYPMLEDHIYKILNLERPKKDQDDNAEVPMDIDNDNDAEEEEKKVDISNIDITEKSTLETNKNSETNLNCEFNNDLLIKIKSEPRTPPRTSDYPNHLMYPNPYYPTLLLTPPPIRHSLPNSTLPSNLPHIPSHPPPPTPTIQQNPPPPPIIPNVPPPPTIHNPPPPPKISNIPPPPSTSSILTNNHLPPPPSSHLISNSIQNPTSHLEESAPPPFEISSELTINNYNNVKIKIEKEDTDEEDEYEPLPPGEEAEYLNNASPAYSSPSPPNYSPIYNYNDEDEEGNDLSSSEKIYYLEPIPELNEKINFYRKLLSEYDNSNKT